MSDTPTPPPAEPKTVAGWWARNRGLLTPLLTALLTAALASVGTYLGEYPRG